MSRGSRAAKITIFDVLFGIIPCATVGGHGTEQVRHHTTNEQTEDDVVVRQVKRDADMTGFRQAVGVIPVAGLDLIQDIYSDAN